MAAAADTVRIGRRHRGPATHLRMQPAPPWPAYWPVLPAAWSYRTILRGEAGGMRLPPQAARPQVRQERGHAVASIARSALSRRGRSTPPRGTPMAFRERTSERGGRSSWRLSGTLRRPPSSELTGGAHSSSRLAPRSLTQSSRCEPYGWCRRIQGRSDRRRCPFRRIAHGLRMLGVAQSMGRPMLYPEGGARSSFPSLPPRLGLPGSGEPRGPL
jgi:hypothetical protein